MHGEALCPSCRLPIDSRDVGQELREAGETQASGAIVTHRRCGTTVRLQFAWSVRRRRRVDSRREFAQTECGRQMMEPFGLSLR